MHNKVLIVGHSFIKSDVGSTTPQNMKKVRSMSTMSDRKTTQDLKGLFESKGVKVFPDEWEPTIYKRDGSVLDEKDRQDWFKTRAEISSKNQGYGYCDDSRNTVSNRL